MYFVGQTTNHLNKIWQEHIRESIRHNNQPLYKDMRKYGIDKFKIRVIEECTSELLNEREAYWINEYNSYDNGYNIRVEDILEKQRKKKESLQRENRFNHIQNLKGVGNGIHHRIQVKTINVETLEEKYYDSITECAKALNVEVTNLHRSLKHGWKVHGHRVIRLESKHTSYSICGIDRITNKIVYTFPSIRAAGRELGNGNWTGCVKSLRHPHRYTWKGCYWFFDDESSSNN